MTNRLTRQSTPTAAAKRFFHTAGPKESCVKSPVIPRPTVALAAPGPRADAALPPPTGRFSSGENPANDGREPNHPDSSAHQEKPRTVFAGQIVPA